MLRVASCKLFVVVVSGQGKARGDCFIFFILYSVLFGDARERALTIIDGESVECPSVIKPIKNYSVRLPNETDYWAAWKWR